MCVLWEPQRYRIHIRLRGLGWRGRDAIVCYAQGYEDVKAWAAKHTEYQTFEEDFGRK